MIQTLNYLNRPEYIFQPLQIYYRIYRPTSKKTKEFETIKLPWSVDIKIRPTEIIGRSLWAMGVYDLSVTEALWRLTEPGETAIDIGSNIGYMTSILAKRVGQSGKVYCFEPHPQVYQELTVNIQSWKIQQEWQQIRADRIALSNHSGTGFLNIPPDFHANRGTASLASSTNESEGKIFDQYPVTLKTLNEFFSQDDKIGIVKIDVEGHELEVLQGASQLIEERKIRDIIFEDHKNYPSPVTEFIENNGYTLFKLYKGFWRPFLISPKNSHFLRSNWEAQSYLATNDPQRAVERLSKKGWQCLAKNL